MFVGRPSGYGLCAARVLAAIWFAIRHRQQRAILAIKKGALKKSILSSCTHRDNLFFQLTARSIVGGSCGGRLWRLLKLAWRRYIRKRRCYGSGRSGRGRKQITIVPRLCTNGENNQCSNEPTVDGCNVCAERRAAKDPPNKIQQRSTTSTEQTIPFNLPVGRCRHKRR